MLTIFLGVMNSEYICGKAEKVTKMVGKTFDPSEEVIAVVNPGRGGLGN